MAGHGTGWPGVAGHPSRMRKIDAQSRVPPWQQIAEHLRGAIRRGDYPPDTPVPSITTLSQEWEVNRKTVRKAMAALVDEGLVDEERGMGYYVKRGQFR